MREIAGVRAEYRARIQELIKKNEVLQNQAKMEWSQRQDAEQRRDVSYPLSFINPTRERCAKALASSQSAMTGSELGISLLGRQVF